MMPTGISQEIRRPAIATLGRLALRRIRAAHATDAWRFLLPETEMLVGDLAGTEGGGRRAAAAGAVTVGSYATTARLCLPKARGLRRGRLAGRRQSLEESWD